MKQRLAGAAARARINAGKAIQTLRSHAGSGATAAYRVAQGLVPPRTEPKAPPPRGFFYAAHLALELITRIEQRSVFVLPGGVAFFLILGLLPAAAAVASIYGLVADPVELVGLSHRLRLLLPEALAELISGGLSRVATAPRSSLGVTAAAALFFSLMSANWGTKALCEALNIVFDRRETRNYFEFTGVTLLMTTLAALIVGAYSWVHFHLAPLLSGGSLAPWGPAIYEAISIWLILSFGIGVLYRFGPAPQEAQRGPPLISAGSMMAAFSIMIVSWILSQQLTNSATFVRNFGPLASIAAVVLWTWVIVVLILIGAEIVEIREEEKRVLRRARRLRLPLLWRL